MLDDVLFNRNFHALLIAHDLPSSLKIFDSKIDYAWSNFPEFLKKLYKLNVDSKNEMKFDFLDNTFSSIAVKSTGRSGTYQRLHISEFGKIAVKYPEKEKELITGTIPSVPIGCRVDVESTAEGEAGAFYDMFWDAWNRGDPTLKTEYKSHFYNWTWDDEEIEKSEVIPVLPGQFRNYQREHDLTNEQISFYYQKWITLNKNWSRLRQEYPTTPEEAFQASLEHAYYTEQMRQVEEDDRICYTPHDKNRYTIPVFDLGGQNAKTGDSTAIIFFQVKGKEIRIIDTYSIRGKPFSSHMSYLDDLKRDKGYKIRDIWLPWDGKIKGYVADKNCFDVAKDHGYTPKPIPNINKIDQINSARDVFGRVFFDQINCSKGLANEESNKISLILSLKSYRKEWDDKLGKPKPTPFHNWASHYADAFAYMSLIVDNYTEQKEDTLKAGADYIARLKAKYAKI
jgi:hypothetical protein